MKTTPTSLAVMIACVVAASGISAQETDTSHRREYTDDVWAEFAGTDTSTCASGIFTSVYLHGERGIRYENGDSRATSSVSIVVRTIDRCAGTTVFVTGTGAADEFYVEPNLKSAGLRTTISAADDSDNPVAIMVDLTWSGVGQKDTVNEHFRTDFGTFTRILNTTDEYRYAVATGAVTVGTLDVAGIPSYDAWIGTTSERINDVYR